MNNVGKKRRRKKDVILPNGDCGDGVCNPFSTDEVPNKYWAQRKRFFQKFDDGVQLDKESWYSVTPEKIARHLGFRMSTFFKTQNGGKSESNGAVILDAFCGCGGNAIGFASQENISLVICVDIDRNKLRMAANNAKIYGIDPKKMRFVVANAIDVIESYSNGDLHSEDKKSSITCEEQEIVEGFTIGTIGLLPQTIDTIFLSPPWGGMDYLREGKNGYNISDCIKIVRQITKEEKTSNEQDESEFLNGEELLVIAAKSARAGKVMYFLPRNINGVSLGRSALKAGYCNSIELEQNYLNGKLKTVTTYMDKEL
jgi:trimethylguanosine synthase